MSTDTARTTSSLNERVLKAQVIAYWQQSPLNRPVKLTSVLRAPMFWAEGYISCLKFVAGRSLGEAERMLGLKPGELGGGAYLSAFDRLPTEDEFDLRSYTHRPGGQAPQPGGEYPVGAGAAQWEVRRNACIPATVVGLVLPGSTIPARW